ncbi:MEROPS family M64 IgA peptidase [Ignavibacterium album JCM 16511]|uniref:MEROPS family M64 IgA peptidase n=1 Tax=Ignavibacterium album (strain DSM 19864 / JCM 16511 / NBRC 101810 / Mat9-16) TaxID=945713 RepID=I0ALL5_IGNAJ|nr:M64 family metallopeptidase [Ignavibacterium album]AFH49872.1 MEROPS family M64 IgA peptidase [Ignavibacterium album JCM 16511]
MRTIIFTLLTSICFSQSDSDFNKFFFDETMRIDYFHIGDAKSEMFTIDKIYRYGIWAGSLTNLIDNLNNGKYYYKIYDAASGKLVYSKGYDTFFGEYASSENGLAGIKKSYHESAIIPFPKSKIIFTIEKRDESNLMNEIFRTEIDPASIYIIKDKVTDSDVEIFKPVFNGDPHKKVDVVILAEGYTIEERGKFVEDLERFVGYFFEQEPYKSNKSNFNFYGVFKPSEESGTDLPGADIFVNTVLNTTFWSLGSERYLMTEDNKTMRDLAAFVPYDAIYIQVNHPRYGGGGIYNQFCTYTTDNQFAKYLFIHEFGHSFTGLADEYYTSDVAYTDFYKPTVEPIEPNITALLDKRNIKWKHLLSEGIEIPTPWEKTEFDRMSYEWLKERNRLNNFIAELKKNRAPEDQIKAAEEEYAIKDKLQSEKVDNYLKSSKYWGKVGAFEGAGYQATGLYRPMLDCIMFSKGDKPFCKVCEEAIKKVIANYTN